MDEIVWRRGCALFRLWFTGIVTITLPEARRDSKEQLMSLLVQESFCIVEHLGCTVFDFNLEVG